MGNTPPELGRWWTQIDELLQERERSVAAAADDVEALCRMED